MLLASSELLEAAPGQSSEKVFVEIAKKYKSLQIALLAEDNFNMSLKDTEDGEQSEEYPEKAILANSSKYLRVSAPPSVIEVAINIESNDGENSINVEGRLISIEAVAGVKLPFALEKDANSILKTIDDILEASIWGIHSSSSQAMHKDMAAFIAEAYESSTLIAPVGSWTATQDLKLLQIIPSCGWPDNKRRVTLMLSALADEASSSLFMSPVLAASHLKSLLSLFRGEKVKQTKAFAFSNAILRSMARCGIPHQLYSSTREVAFEGKRPEFDAYLMTWERFLRECGSFPGLDEHRLRKFTQDAFDVADSSRDDDKPIDSGLLFGLTAKAVKDCLSKSETMHRIRTLLASRDDTSLTTVLQQRVMPTGTSVPPYARDRTMPVWWTTAHDIKLLKLTCVHGLHNWKKILAADSQTINLGDLHDSLSIIEAPLDFVIPLRENGQEWVLALTPKVAEKRLAHILKAVDSFTTVNTLPQSPRRNTTVFAVAKDSKSVKRVKPPTASSFNWTTLQVPETKRESVQSQMSHSIPFSDRVFTAVAVNQTTISSLTKHNVVVMSHAPEKPNSDAQIEEPRIMDDDCILIHSGRDESLATDVIFVNDKTPMHTDRSLPYDALDQQLALTTAAPAPVQFMQGSGACVVMQSSAPDEVIEKVAPEAIKGALPIATAVKKRKVDESKVTVKKPVPSSKSILSFFTKIPSAITKSPDQRCEESTLLS